MASQSTALDNPSRLDALRSYKIVDTLPAPAFDRLAKLAAQICGAPYAAITFVDGTRQFFKARVGFTDGQPLESSGFCSQAIRQSDLFVVPDTTKDEQCATNPLVSGTAQVRFYAGMPLMTAEGHTCLPQASESLLIFA